MDNGGITTDSTSSQEVVNQTYTQSSRNYTFAANILLAATLFAVSIKIFHKECYTKAFLDTVSTLTLFVVVFGIIEVCLRIYSFFVELLHLNSKYDGNFVTVFEAVNLSVVSWAIILLSFVIFLILHITAGNTFEYLWNQGPLVCIPTLICCVIVCKLIGLTDSKLNTSELISRMSGVDYGTGMAYSYFYGYLKIILPADGVNKGLRFKMEQYEADQNVTIPVKKLFVLVPKSGHIPPDLREASYNWLESTTSLEHEVRDRAGTKRRTYRNTVYKIHPGGEGKPHRPVYVTTEGATPMLTLWEILQHSHPQTATYREYRNQIIDAFCDTVRTLLENDPQCRDVCELILYDDYDSKRNLRNVGEILLKRIKQEAAFSV